MSRNASFGSRRSEETEALLETALDSSPASLTCRRGGQAPQCGYADATPNDPQKRKAKRRLLLAMGLCASFMTAEAVGGYYAHSLAVMSDAAHLLSDLGAFCVSLLTLTLAQRRAASTHTFGYHRAELLGALFSVASLWLVTGALLVAALKRLSEPEDVSGLVMMSVAIMGVFVNLALAAVLRGAQGHGHSHGGLSGSAASCGHSHGTPETVPQLTALSVAASAPSLGHSHNGVRCGGHPAPVFVPPSASATPITPPPIPPGATFFTRGRFPIPLPADEEAPPAPEPAVAETELVLPAAERETSDVNMRSAYLHVLADLAQSVGVALAGAIIWAVPSARWVDPACTLLFSIFVLVTSAGLLRDIADVIMERSPRHLDPAAVVEGLRRLPGVAGVHDLHLWQLMPGKPLMTVHIDAAPGVESHAVLAAAQGFVTKEHGIEHATIQVEDWRHT